ncbi:GPW/gp25 family protein [Aquibium microcysteis]|uniref:GPW/gp25 family protein n=1 Tax=Aquibium microcysteis TaxID=675281 RepID=UPI00165D1640|nr:baseplate assembly protein [Aquibium microcysteis]
MSRVGLDARTGRLLYGWEHCVQSITEILHTEFGERVQRRLFGSDLPRIIDRPQNEETVMDIYMATAQALEPRMVEGRQYGEPGFVLLRTSLDAATPGRVTLLLSGVFFERGHLGDYSNPSERQVAYAVTQAADGLSIEKF